MPLLPDCIAIFFASANWVKADILVGKMVHHPHGKYQRNITEAVVGNSFKRILYRQITVAVKCN